MDDQTQQPFDPSATQVQPGSTRSTSARPKTPKTAQDKSANSQNSQPTPTGIEHSVTQLLPPTQRSQATTGRQPAQRQSAPLRQQSPNSGKQPVQPPQPPQPIRFPDVEEAVTILEEKVAEVLTPARLRRTRRWFRSRSGRIVVPLVALFLGIIIGASSLLWYGLSGEGPVTIVPPGAKGNLIVQIDKDFLTQLVRKNITSSTGSIPGTLENVNLTLKSGAQLTITADDVYSVLGLQLSRRLTIDIQPYVQSCQIQTRITHVDMGGVPVTAFAEAFAGNINKQFAIQPTGLPSGFTYCASGVRTQPDAMFVTYQATSVDK